MKPPVFAYHDLTSLAEALELLRRYGADAKVLAGGQSLMPLLNFRLSAPAALIDLNRISALAYLRQDVGELGTLQLLWPNNRLQPDRGPRAALSECERTQWGRGG